MAQPGHAGSGGTVSVDEFVIPFFSISINVLSLTLSGRRSNFQAGQNVGCPRRASMADDIQDTGPQGQPHKLQKLVLRSSRVVYLPLLARTRSLRRVGIADFQHVRKKRGDAIG